MRAIFAISLMLATAAHAEAVAVKCDIPAQNNDKTRQDNYWIDTKSREAIWISSNHSLSMFAYRATDISVTADSFSWNTTVGKHKITAKISRMSGEIQGSFDRFSSKGMCEKSTEPAPKIIEIGPLDKLIFDCSTPKGHATLDIDMPSKVATIKSGNEKLPNLKISELTQNMIFMPQSDGLYDSVLNLVSGALGTIEVARQLSLPSDAICKLSSRGPSSFKPKF